MNVRPAVAEDRAAYLLMVEEYLRELQALGGDLRPSRETLNSYGIFFDQALAGGGGSVIVCEDGFCSASPLENPFDSSFGKTAISLGVWVSPETRRRGLAGQMRKAMHADLRRQGFDTLVAGVLSGNVPAILGAQAEGMHFDTLFGHLPLEEDT